MTSLLPDVRFALRTVLRSPLFASVAILSLSLGIGANTAIFTIMDQLMLRVLPIQDPQQIVMLYQKGANNGSNMGDRMQSYPIYRDFQQKASQFQGVLCRRLFAASVALNNQTERVDAEMVSGNYFTTLGVKPAAGRVFNSQEDDRVYMGHPVVVLSYDYWTTRFSKDPAIIGRKILVNNYPMTVVGVSAAGFSGLDPAVSPQIRVPILMKPVLLPDWNWFQVEDRRCRWIQVFARLKPGYTAQSAQPQLQGLYHQIREYEMSLPAAKDWSKYGRDEFMRGAIQIEKAATGYSDLRNSFSKALIVLMCMVGLVLLIACANVANLMIARAFARQKEIAVRLSLGASRGRLVQQLLVESMLLSLAGAVGGIAIAMAMTRALLALIPVEGSPLLIQAWPDLRILLFTLGLTLVTSVLFGLVPAIRASRPDLWTTLKDAVGSIAGSGGSLILRKGLVASQVALSFLLLFGAGLFVRSLQNLQSTHTGFRDLDRLVTFQMAPALNGYDVPRTMHFYQELVENIRAVPGVQQASLAQIPVLHGWEWDSSTSVEGHTFKDDEDQQAFMNGVLPGYFQAMGISVLQGRDFDRRDIKDDSKVAIVNQAFAKHFFGDKSAVGRHIGRGGGPKTKLDTEIVGVVADSLYEGPRDGVHRQVFVPLYGNGSAAFYVRTGMGNDAAYRTLRAEVKKLDATMPIFEMKTLEDQLNEVLLTERLIAMLSAGFGLLATLLAAIGLYGVMAFAVARRTKEMGVRMALGASQSSVVWLVLREVLLLVVIGLAIGIPAALASGRYVSTQLYEIKPADPWIGATTAILLLVVSAVAGMIPAMRASRVDPILALRYE
jgi:predicted permease